MMYCMLRDSVELQRHPGLSMDLQDAQQGLGIMPQLHECQSAAHFTVPSSNKVTQPKQH